MRRVFILAVLLAAALTASGFHQWSTPAYAQGVCGTENAQMPTVGGGVITAPHVLAGDCPTSQGCCIDLLIKPQAESGGTWHAWNCSGSTNCQLHTGSCNSPCLIQADNGSWDPTGSPAGLDPNHLCAYRERIWVQIFNPNGGAVYDTYASGVLPASC